MCLLLRGLIAVLCCGLHQPPTIIDAYLNLGVRLACIIHRVPTATSTTILICQQADSGNEEHSVMEREREIRGVFKGLAAWSEM